MRSAILSVLAISLGYLLAVFAPTIYSKPQLADARLVIRAEVASGDLFEVFINGETTPIKLPVLPGQVNDYLFTPVPSELHSLRVDPTDRAGALVRFLLVELRRNDELLATYTAEEILQAPRDALLEIGNGQLESTTSDPVLVIPNFHLLKKEQPTTDDQSWFMSVLGRYGLLILALIGLSGALFTKEIRTALLLAIFSIWSTYWLVQPLAILVFNKLANGPLLPVSSSVGNASFIGYSKLGDHVAFYILLLSAPVTILLAYLASRLARGSSVRVLNETESSTELPTLQPFPWLGFSILCAAMFLLAIPPITEVRASLPTLTRTLGDFDWKNFYVWDYLMQYGFLPHRDYWFPYDGDATQMGSLPPSLWFAYWVRISIAISSLYVFTRFSGNSLVKGVYWSLGLFVLTEAGWIQATKRYLPLFLATSLLGYATRPRTRIFTLPKSEQPAEPLPSSSRRSTFIDSTLIFDFSLAGVVTGAIFWREPNQLAYLAPAVLLLLLGWVIREYRQVDKLIKLVLPILCYGGAATTLIAARLFYFHLSGQLTGFLRFLKLLPGLMTSCAIPASPIDWVKLNGSPESLCFFATLLLLTSGVTFLCSKSSTAERKHLGLLLLASSLSVIVIYQKMLVRPHMASQLLSPIVAIILVVLACSLKNLSFRRALPAVVAIGMLWSFTPKAAQPDYLINTVNFQRKNLSNNVAEMLRGAPLTAEERDRYFSTAPFGKLPSELSELLDYLRGLDLKPLSQELYVLGNESYLYPFLKQRQCVHSNFYDGSSIAWQREVVACLEQTRPRVVVYREDPRDFDSVPNVVRSPLLFQHVIANYLPARQFGSFRVLVPKGDSPTPLSLWQQILGSELNLGHVAELTSFGEPSVCQIRHPLHLSQADGCTEIVELPPCANSSCEGALLFRVANSDFKVKFSSRLNSSRRINLTRLWFWNIGDSGYEKTVLDENGQELAIQTRDIGASTLY